MLAVGVFLFALVLPNPLGAGGEYTVLTIAVRNAANDRPVHQASVTLNFMNPRRLRRDQARVWNSKTNRRGLVEFPEIPSGKVRIQVIAPAYRTHGAVFEINGEEKTVTVKLDRPKKRQVSAHERPEPEAKSTKEKNDRK